MSRRPPLVVVSGMPASGKSTLAAELTRRLHLPLLAKDAIKEALTRVDGRPPDREASRRLGARTVRVLHELATAHLDRGVGIVLECNFKHGVSEPELRAHAARACAVNVHCEVDAALAIDRYRSRAGTRHPAHIEDAVLAEATPAGWAADHARMDLGIPALTVDTTDGYEPAVDAIIEWVEEGIRC